MVWVARALCVSPEGLVFTPGTAAFRDHLGHRYADVDLTEFAVRNMGYVLLVLLPDEAARVRCRPELLTPTAVRVTCRELHDRQIRSVTIECVPEGCGPQQWPNYRALIRRLRMSRVRSIEQR